MDVSRELALLPSPPRKVRRCRYFQLAGHYVFLVVLLMFVQVFWSITVGTLQILWFSTVVPATVTNIQVSPGGRGPSYNLCVSYDFQGAAYAHQISIGPRQAEELKPGDVVSVQLLPERPDRPQLYQEDYPCVFVTVLLCLFTLLPTGGLAKLLWQLFVAPWQVRMLMREGAATPGRIVDKKQTSGRCPTYRIAYEYQAPSPDTLAPVAVRTSMNVQLEDFLQAAVGDEVVVLYQPKRPRKSVIGRYTDYQFVSSSDLAEDPRGTSAPTISISHGLAILFIVGLAFFAIAKLCGWW
jgi:hypothetical protein